MSGAAQEEPPTPVRPVQLADTSERERVEAILAGLLVGTPDVTVSDRPLPGSARYVLTTWVAIGHQRHDTLELSLSDLRRGLSGIVSDWRSLGGSPGPITVVVAGDADAVAGDIGIDGFAVNALRPPSEDVAAIVAATPGALGLVPIDELTPGTLPLVIEEHDPLRDPSRRPHSRACAGSRPAIQQPGRWSLRRWAGATLSWSIPWDWSRPATSSPRAA